MSVATGTLEDENYQAAVTPERSRGVYGAPPPTVVRLAAPSEPLSYIGQDRGSWQRDQRSLLRRRLRFLDSARKDIFIPTTMKRRSGQARNP